MTINGGTQVAADAQGDLVLRTIGLSKSFGKLDAVKNLNIELRRGEVFGFLGRTAPVRAPRSDDSRTDCTDCWQRRTL